MFVQNGVIYFEVFIEKEYPKIPTTSRNGPNDHTGIGQVACEMSGHSRRLREENSYKQSKSVNDQLRGTKRGWGVVFPVGVARGRRN